MIELRQSPDGIPVILAYVTDFSGSMGFCEYRIRNSLKGIEPIQTQVTIDGTQSHEREAQYEREHFEFKPITHEELDDINSEIEYARESLYTRYLKYYEFGDDKVSLLIFGRADKVKRARNMLIVEESKYPQNMERYQTQFEPYLDQKLQILLYLNFN